MAGLCFFFFFAMTIAIEFCGGCFYIILKDCIYYFK